MGLAESAHHGRSVLVLGVDGVVESADIGGGEFSGEIGHSGAELREPRERSLPDDRDGIIRRKVMAVVFKSDEAERVDEAVGGVAGHNVDLMIDQGAVDETEIHDFRRFGEVEIVAAAPAAEAVGPLEKFVADTGAPLGGEGNDVGDFLEMEIFCVVAANHHGEGVFKTERFGDFEVEALGVELLDAVVHGDRITLRRFIQDGGQGRAGVFDIQVEFACQESFVNEERAAEVGLALNGNAGFCFDVLGKELRENDLLGKEFGADRDFRLRRTMASAKKVEEVKEINGVKEAKR